jgi:hypothetical protein
MKGLINRRDNYWLSVLIDQVDGNGVPHIRLIPVNVEDQAERDRPNLGSDPGPTSTIDEKLAVCDLSVVSKNQGAIHACYYAGTAAEVSEPP